MVTTINAIKQLKATDGINLRGLQMCLEELANLGIEIRKPTHLGEEYFKTYPYLDNFIKNLEARFDAKSIMASFNPSKLPDTNNSEKLSLAHHYEGIVADSTEYLEEWSSFRQFVNDNCMHLKQVEIIKTVQ